MNILEFCVPLVSGRLLQSLVRTVSAIILLDNSIPFDFNSAPIIPIILRFCFLNILQTSGKYHSCYFFFLLCYCLHFVLHILNFVPLLIFIWWWSFLMWVLFDWPFLLFHVFLFDSFSVFQSPSWFSPPYFEILPILSRSYIDFFYLWIRLFDSSIWSLISFYLNF